MEKRRFSLAKFSVLYAVEWMALNWLRGYALHFNALPRVGPILMTQQAQQIVQTGDLLSRRADAALILGHAQTATLASGSRGGAYPPIGGTRRLYTRTVIGLWLKHQLQWPLLPQLRQVFAQGTHEQCHIRAQSHHLETLVAAVE